MPAQLSYSELRQNLKLTIDQVNDTHQAKIITSNKMPKAVLLSYEDYCSLEETAYLLRSPAMAKRLYEALIDTKQGKLIAKDLVDPDLLHEA